MTELNKQKIFWHSRRGMLELDLLLVPFATEVFENLSTEDQLLYRDLLAEEDQDLWNWFLERVEPSEARFKSMIERILAHKANQVHAGSS
ncbi:MAG: succinate dehydrogenase assembly factor 2 family protein [Gammaproteobacteria bacterium TMED163]|jgi:antitoxin CptB|nr:MAG: succinate dehydrogenase assembly factor 2 family protein [Gammaproteobacteria bacterium TMED163]